MESGYKKQKGLNRMINLAAGNYVRRHLLYLPPVFKGEKIEAQKAVICPRLPPPNKWVTWSLLPASYNPSLRTCGKFASDLQMSPNKRLPRGSETVSITQSSSSQVEGQM